MYKFLLLTLYLIFILQSICFSQAVSFEHISSAQGLSQNSVNNILQDHEGFMWFSTRDGLNKYDGYTFTVYQNDPADSASLSANHTRVLLEDHNHVLWVGGGGLNKFNASTQKFTIYANNPSDSASLSDNNISAICQDLSGAL